MFNLLKSDDKFVLDNTKFVKNAVLYKDMLCFYEAYRLIMECKDDLPNFCYSTNKEVCLEGICLLIKMYATEFKFETLKLTLDYLKILYFAVASYTDGDSVDHDAIAIEFDDYRRASMEFCNEQREEVEEKQKAVNASNKEIKQKLAKSRKMEKQGKILSVLSIVMLILSVLAISAPVLCTNYLPDNKILLWVSVSAVVVGFVLTIIFKIVGKKLLNTSSDMAFHVQNLKKNNVVSANELAQMQAKYYKVFCEKYEYKTSFSELFSRYTNVLTIDEILEKAKSYKILTYNLVSDISKLFKSQQKEVNLIAQDLEGINFAGDYKKEFASIYTRICEQDWLYYNAEVRIHFLKKFTDIGEKDFDWKLEIAGKKVNPFDVRIRELSREMVAFSYEKDKKMVSAPLADLLKTNYFKSLEQLNFRNGYTVEELKKVKANYLKHFYRYDVVSRIPGVLFDRKETQKIKKLEFPIDEMERVPTLVSLKLKLVENLAGLGNSDANVIKSISQSIFTEEIQDLSDGGVFSEEDIDYPKFAASSIEEFEDYFVFDVNGEKKYGIKIN